MSTEAAPVGSNCAPRPAKAAGGLKAILILGTLSAFASISTDFNLTALPAMQEALAAPAGAIEFSVSAFLIGFSLSQLIWGPIGDRHGRKGPIAIGLLLFVIGSAGCALAGSVTALLAWRVLQAFGACACVVLARAMVRDQNSGDQAARMLSMLLTVMALSPLLGPLLGAQLLSHFGWQACFWAMATMGVLTLMALVLLPETLPEHRRRRDPLRNSVLQYWPLIRDRRVVLFAAAGGAYYIGTYSYVVATPFVFISHFHLTPDQFALVFGAGMVSLMISNQINSRLVVRFGTLRMLRFGTGVAAVASLLLLASIVTEIGGLWGLICTMVAYASASGFVVANSIAGAISDHPERAGTVSALAGAIHYGSGIIGSGLVGLFSQNIVAWGVVMVIAGVGALCCASLVRAR